MKLFKKLSKNIDYEWLFMDGTHVRAYQHSLGVASITDETISKSVGDNNSSKIHMIVDTCGNLYEFLITYGTTHDIKIVSSLLLSKVSLKATEYVSADKDYDRLRGIITEQSAKAAIPKKTKYKN